MRPLDRAEYLGYTPATESRRLIGHGLPKQLPETLGGRHRFTPLSLYVGDRLAAAAFARLDGVGLFWLDVWLLSQRGGRWSLRTGSSAAAAPDDEDVLAPRSDAAVLNGHTQDVGTARYDTSPVRWLPWPSKWVMYGILRLSAEVGAVRIGAREIQVPEHGLQALAWRPGRKGVELDLLDHKAERMSGLRLR
ncbi:hypothetical protein SAMN05444920_101751 [Nonomuraea solani]|uniref:Uncharacterized protein n=1 Tax=Nonomuraea solani TaxID=1144553 RepID=A0A1H5V3K4_9ACTN|nr:hypothetical protein [Nonomuraea solani]SEF81879.1 hypothetical protein SAMN05444920_101751 [Nonomuraea solani]